MRPTFRIAALSAVIALSAADAQAQDEHRGPGPAAGQMQARMQQMREARDRQRAQDLSAILRLRPDQQPALTAFLQSRRPPQGEGMKDRRAGRGEAGPMTTPQQLDDMARREAERAAMQRRRADALRAFYASLSPEQRPVFDALQRLEHAGRGDGGWGHRGFGGGPRGGQWGGQWGGPPAGGPPPRD